MPNNSPIWKPLRGYGAFTRVLSHGKVFSSGAVRCFVTQEERAKPEVSIGIGVTRAVRKSAARNRIRRLLRESVRLHQHKIVNTGTKKPISAQLVLMYVGRDVIHPASIRLVDLENSVAQLLSSALAFCEAGNRRAGRSAD